MNDITDYIRYKIPTGVIVFDQKMDIVYSKGRRDISLMDVDCESCPIRSSLLPYFNHVNIFDTEDI